MSDVKVYVDNGKEIKELMGVSLELPKVDLKVEPNDTRPGRLDGAFTARMNIPLRLWEELKDKARSRVRVKKVDEDLRF